MTNVYESQGLCRNQTCRIAKMNKWCGKNERFWDSGYFHTSFRISLRGYNSAVYIKAKWHRRWALMMLSLGLNDAIIGAKRQRHWAPMTKPTLNNWKTILYKTYRNSSEKVWKNEANNVKIPCAENDVISQNHVSILKNGINISFIPWTKLPAPRWTFGKQMVVPLWCWAVFYFPKIHSGLCVKDKRITLQQETKSIKAWERCPTETNILFIKHTLNAEKHFSLFFYL